MMVQKFKVYRAVLECLECRTSVSGKSLKECMSQLKCKNHDGINDYHKDALRLDGRPVFELKQIIKDGETGKSIVEITLRDGERLREPIAKPKNPSAAWTKSSKDKSSKEDEDDESKEDDEPNENPPKRK